MHHNLWVLLELKQVRRRGSGNVSLPRMRPEDYEHEEGGSPSRASSPID